MDLVALNYSPDLKNLIVYGMVIVLKCLLHCTLMAFSQCIGYFGYVDMPRYVGLARYLDMLGSAVLVLYCKVLLR